MTQQEFQGVAHEIVGLAFTIHNEMGRLFDEDVYRDALADALGNRAQTEVGIRVEYGDYVKTYRRDLVVDGWATFELKVADVLDTAHESQLLNYLFLSGQYHGKLINFKTPSVEHKFVNSTLTLEGRRRFQVKGDRGYLRDVLLPFVSTFGTGLSHELYADFTSHHAHGDCPLQVTRKGRCISTSKYTLLEPDSIFRVTTLETKQLPSNRKHLGGQLQHLNIPRLQWANIHRDAVSFETLVS